MKVVFIGCVEFSYTVLRHLLSLNEIEIIGVVTRKKSPVNADFCSLEPLATKAGISCFFTAGNNQSDIAMWLKKLKPDVIYCFGWSYLLNSEIIQIPHIGVIGYHPAALPENRGRHPIIWALALGLSTTASTFFLMDEGADSGDILNQKFIQIEPTDDAASLYQKITRTALQQITVLTKDLASNKYIRIPQEHSKANYWRKRNKSDGQIDWRMSAAVIHNLVRALTRPYVGAHCIYNDDEIKIWKTEVLNPDLPNIEPGKILKVEGSSIVIKCGGGVLRLLEHEFKTIPAEGCYL